MKRHNAEDALRALEKTYGTAALAAAMETLRYDREFRARALAANPAELHSALAIMPLDIAAEVEANVAAIGASPLQPRKSWLKGGSR